MNFTIAYYADGRYVGLAIVSACCAHETNPQAQVVLYSPKHVDGLPAWLEQRLVQDDRPEHYIRKPRAWLDVLSRGDNAVLLDADTVILGPLEEAVSACQKTGLAATVADSSYMPAITGLARLDYDHPDCRSDVASRIFMCPANGDVLRNFYQLPDWPSLQNWPYFAVGWLAVQKNEKVLRMFQRTIDFGLAHSAARHLALWPENTPMNCAAVEQRLEFAQLDPFRYGMLHDGPGKVLWHFDGFKVWGRKLSVELGKLSPWVLGVLQKCGMQDHYLVNQVW